MNYLFFDTETTGLPKRYKAPYTQTDNWPYIVQLSWLLADQEGHVIKEADYIVKVDVPIPIEASRVHGITNEISLEKGVDIKEVLKHFQEDMKNATHLIGHNVHFDLPIVQCELLRNELEHQIKLPTFCTMRSATDYCKIPGNYGYKWPKLEELYQVCFSKKLLNAHNALADVRATYEVFYHLKKESVFSL